MSKKIISGVCVSPASAEALVVGKISKHLIAYFQQHLGQKLSKSVDAIVFLGGQCSKMHSNSHP